MPKILDKAVTTLKLTALSLGFVSASIAIFGSLLVFIILLLFHTFFIIDIILVSVVVFIHFMLIAFIFIFIHKIIRRYTENS